MTHPTADPSPRGTGGKDRASTARLRTERGLERLIAFTDAAVAIALTLLILPLVDAAGEIDNETLPTLLGDNVGLLLGFAISFVVIGRLWYAHHQVFEGVAAYDGALLWLTLFWLLGVAFFPFGANVLSHSGADRHPGVYGLYVGTILAISLLMLAIEVHLRRHPELLRSDVETDDVVDIPGSVIFSALLALALVVSMAVPAIGLFALFLLFLQAPLVTMVDRRERRRSPDTGGHGPTGG